MLKIFKFKLPFLKITIFQKLLIGIFAMLMLNTIIAFVGIISINELENSANDMLKESKEQSAFQKLKLNFDQLLMPANDYLVHGNKVEFTNFDQLLLIVQEQISECREFGKHPREHFYLNEFESRLNEVKSLVSNIFELKNPIGNPEGAIMMEEMDAITDNAIIEIEEIIIQESLEMTEYIKTNQATNIRATRIIIIIGFSIAICLVVGGYFYVREITRPIKHLARTAQKISLGDLSAKAEIQSTTSDEIADFAKSFNSMIGVLEKTTVSRDYFDNILNRMVDTLIITDPDSNITIVNQAALDLLEYTEEEIIGQPFEMILSKENSKEAINTIDFSAKIEAESVQNVYNTYYSKSGRIIPVSFSRSFMYDNENNKSGMICVAFHNADNLKEDQKQAEENSENESRYIKAVGEIPLTNRELEIIKLITMELSNREIAEKLFISVRTVETHRKNIMQKLQTKSVIALVHYAAQNGII